MMHASRHNLSSPRHGFSLLELLVVVGIIAALVALVVTVLGNSINTANRAATMVLITKLDKQVQQLVEAFRKNNDPRSTAIRREAANIASGNSPLGRILVNPVTGIPPANLDAGAAIAIKRRYRLLFPQNAADVTNSSGQRLRGIANWAVTNDAGEPQYNAE